MTNEERRATARALMDNQLFTALFSELEHEAFNTAVWAAGTDQDTRAAACAEVRAIRNLLGKLNGLAEANPKARSAPA